MRVESPLSAVIEPNTIKRRGVGLRAYDPDRAFNGFTLFAPDGKPDGKAVYLIDMEGRVAHTWDMPCPAGLTASLTERGTLLYNGYIPNPQREGSTFVGGAVMEVDWKGRILWELRHPDHHHDGIRLRNGNVLLICAKPLPDEAASRIRGGRAGTEGDDGRIYGDYLVEMTIGGEPVWEWRCWEHLDPVEDGFTAVQDERAAWPMGNGISEMPDGNILLSFRANSTVVMIERQSGAVYWKLGAPPLSGQHAPHILANGNLLLFDNGPHRLDHSFPHSRVLEIEPATKKIVWKYQDAPVWNFYSPRVSNAQRLPNGNTLINEGSFGRFFEVTAGGDVVWEYVNPYFVGTAKAQHNRVARAHRYSPEEIAMARKTERNG